MSARAYVHPEATLAALLVAGLMLAACGEGGRRDRAPATAPAPPSPTAETATTPASAAPAQTAGSLLIPVPGVDFAMLRDNFDEMRGTGRHEALDIMAPRGTPVRAVADGRVIKLFTSAPGGLTVYQLDTSQSVVYYYAHLDSYSQGLREGLEVRRGDPIGSVGSTGNAQADAPHLHFAVFVLGPQREWWNGTPVNPYPLFAAER